MAPHTRPRFPILSIIGPHGLELVAAEHLAVGTIAEVAIDLRVDGGLEEPDRPVAEAEVGPAGMVAAEAPHQGGVPCGAGAGCGLAFGEVVVRRAEADHAEPGP